MERLGVPGVYSPGTFLGDVHDNDRLKGPTMSVRVFLNKQLRDRGVAEWLISALSRGMGVHHARMNRKYCQVVEKNLHQGYLQVAIATGTLLLSMNLPYKTVVLAGDSVFLTALNFRQCAGRAGQRGFNLLGNVLFVCIPVQRVCCLLSSRLPDLNGRLRITKLLVLRLATLFHGSNNFKLAVRTINFILSLDSTSAPLNLERLYYTTA